MNCYLLGGGSNLIVLVSRYKLSLFHTLTKPGLLGFPRIGVFASGLLDHVFKRFASTLILQKFLLFLIFPCLLARTWP